MSDKVELRSADECARCNDKLASIAHDVKTFVTIIDGYVDLLLAGKLGELNGSQHRVLEEMHSSIRYLDHHTKEFLTFAKLQAGTPDLDLREGDLNACLQELLRFWAPQFESKTIANYFVAGSLPKFAFDYHKVQHIVSNLLDNSLKFTPPGGTVYITSEPYTWERRSRSQFISRERRVTPSSLPNCARIVVTDSGPGIPPEFHQDIFEEFHQLPSNGPDDPGVGLGLAIARRLVALHGGKIWVESEPNTGCKFCFLLPYSR